MPPINPTSLTSLAQALQSQRPAAARQSQPPIIDENEFQLFQPRRGEASELRSLAEVKPEQKTQPHKAGPEEIQGLTMQELSNLAGVLSHMLTEDKTEALPAKGTPLHSMQDKPDPIKPNPPGTYINVRV